MLGLRLRFRAIASQLQVLNLNAKDLNEEYLLTVAKEHYPKRFDRAVKMRADLTDSATLWEILGIDAVILYKKMIHSLIFNEGIDRVVWNAV